ncbi:MAG: hypothetical protein V1930_00975 [Pseudomonadota bacterium]
MIWDVFSPGKNGGKGTILEHMDLVIRRIEAFAPRKHRSKRELFYYNYRVLKAYVNPLQRLLEVIAEGKKMEDRKGGAFTWKLFTRLKDFYDPNQRLSIGEAILARSLKIKMSELFLFFYDVTDMTTGKVEKILEQQKAEHERS